MSLPWLGSQGADERKRIVQALGGKVVLTPAEQNLAGCLQHMRELTGSDPEKYFVVNQFQNPDNPEVHYRQTGPEIWQSTQGSSARPGRALF